MTLRVFFEDSQASPPPRNVAYANTTVDGVEYGCLGCADLSLFQMYLHQQAGSPPVNSGRGPETVVTNFLSQKEFEAMRNKLTYLYGKRRLVLGQFGSLMQMDFITFLTDLARGTPFLDTKCGDGKSPACQALFSGERTAWLSQLQEQVVSIFGEGILDFKYNEKDEEKVNRERAAKVLKLIKTKYSFYHHKCMADQCTSDKAPTGLVGRVSCKNTTNSADCVYAEVLHCQQCDTTFEYDRLHGVPALLDTVHVRNGIAGQCEEFSRLGHGIFVALGFEARYIYDFTDHVWIELRIPAKTGQWIHADPSEGIFDNPKMYEAGWGKKLTVILAISPEEIEHVTARYTDNYAATVQRRGFSEDLLYKVISQANQRLRYELPLQRFGQEHKSSWDDPLQGVAAMVHFAS
mmetsp:Transcript_53855/g.118111  ORF Transcript_53855/g.118111 Transcript_53855/m.118111 type:complete len:406 (+) Transcript_53855:3-1220(+)